MDTPSWFVYMLHCADGSYYIGATSDVERRVREHNMTSRAARYTRSRRPVTLVYVCEHPTQSSAQSAEAALKKCRRAEKQRLAATWERTPTASSGTHHT